jgi:hypothetical protein
MDLLGFAATFRGRYERIPRHRSGDRGVIDTERPEGRPIALLECAILLQPGDDVVVVTTQLTAGTTVATASGDLVVRATVPRGHKLAVRAVPSGSPVHKYGQSIGRATVDIAVGDHVHVHNLGMDDRVPARSMASTHHALPAVPGPVRTFQGYRRADGRTGTRNAIAVLASVNCASSTARLIADAFGGPALESYPTIDGVVALTHSSGCGLVSGSPGAATLLRTLRGYAVHPNIAGLLVVGLGCEMIPGRMVTDGLTCRGTLVEQLTIPNTGGYRASARGSTVSGGCCRSSPSVAARPSRSANSSWASTAAAPTATPGSRRTLPSASPPTGSSPPEGRRSSRRHPRSSARSTC